MDQRRRGSGAVAFAVAGRRQRRWAGAVAGFPRDGASSADPAGKTASFLAGCLFFLRADYVGKNVPTAVNEQVRVMVKERDGADKVLIYQ